MEWKDCTTYPRGDKERVPTAWEIKSGDLRIVVTSGHIYYKGRWVMHCARLRIDTYPLSATSKKEAQLSAIEVVRQKIYGLKEDIDLLTT